MSIFGSREEDPLLQDELFTPDASVTGEQSETDNNDGATRRRVGDRSDDTRQIVCSREEAADGHLDQLNRAFNSDWELTRIQVSDDNQFVFTLRPTRCAGSGTESIL